MTKKQRRSRRPRAPKRRRQPPAKKKPLTRKRSKRAHVVRLPTERRPRRPRRRKPPARKRSLTKKEKARKAARRQKTRKAARRIEAKLRQLAKLQERLRRKLPRKRKSKVRRSIRELKERLQDQLRRRVEREARAVRKEALTRKQLQQEASKSYHKHFDRLKEKARKKGQLPKLDARRRRMLSDHVEGRRLGRRLDDVEVTESGIEDVLYEIEQVVRVLLQEKPVYGLWLAHINFLAMGSFIYGKVESLDDPEDPHAPDFHMGTLNTGYWNTPAGMLAAARAHLERALSDKYSLVKITGIEVRNYSHRRPS